MNEIHVKEKFEIHEDGKAAADIRGGKGSRGYKLLQVGRVLSINSKGRKAKCEKKNTHFCGGVCVCVCGQKKKVRKSEKSGKEGYEKER